MIRDKEFSVLNPKKISRIFDFTLNNTFDSVAIHDKEMNYIWVNDNYENNFLKDFNLTKKDVIGKKVMM